MKIKLWGVRGSLPSPLLPEVIQKQTRTLLYEAFDGGLSSHSEIDQFLSAQPAWRHGGFGGNTACYEISSQDKSVIIDAGSGLRALAQQLAGTKTEVREFHIFFTHFHWDHLIGLCFFIPIFTRGTKIHFYAVQPELEEVIRTLFKKPYFPVSYEALGATIFYHRLEARKPLVINGLTLTPYLLDHPDPCWGYRVEHNGKVLSLCVDTECTRVSREDLQDDLPLYQGVNAMVFDAQYTLQEAATRLNWGHAAATIGLDIAMREGIERVYFVHHDPSLSDQDVNDSAIRTRDYYDAYIKSERRAKRLVNEVKWQFAHEGTVINL